MKMRYLLLIFVIILLLSGCAKTPEEIDSRVEALTEENSQLKEQISALESQISSLEDQLNTVTEERDEYLKELDEFYLTQITGTVDLVYWDDTDMVRAFGDYNEKFKTASWETYVYRRDKKDFYWQFGGSFVQDPFFELRRKDQDHELDIFHFRTERLAINNNRTLAQEKYTRYLEVIIRETQIDKDLNCYQQTTCRDIKVVKCTKDNKNYHSWFEGSHLFITRFDDREALDAFEDFYCRSQPGSMTIIE